MRCDGESSLLGDFWTGELISLPERSDSQPGFIRFIDPLPGNNILYRFFLLQLREKMNPKSSGLILAATM